MACICMAYISMACRVMAYIVLSFGADTVPRLLAHGEVEYLDLLRVDVSAPFVVNHVVIDADVDDLGLLERDLCHSKAFTPIPY